MMDPDFETLFDGSSTEHWHMVGQGNIVLLDGMLAAVPGTDIGLLWCDIPTPADYELRLQWQRTESNDNSGVFVRFPDPGSKGYDNQAYVGVDFGFEIQIDDAGEPDGAPMHRTGAIYDQPTQQFSLMPSLPPGEWNDYRIIVVGQIYTVFLNGTQVTQFTFLGDPAHADRGLPSTAASPRYVGVQSHTGLVAFRDIRIAPR
jgi:hypothetical protein